jgi:hypothetical protein
VVREAVVREICRALQVERGRSALLSSGTAVREPEHGAREVPNVPKSPAFARLGEISAAPALI